MVYDEGIEFGMGKKNTSNYSNFFVFMQYSKNDGKTLPEVKTKFYSHCYHAFIGWFHTEGNKWGCLWGHKKIADWKKPTNGEAPAKQRVLEKSIVKESFLEKGENYETNFLQINSKLKYKNKNSNKSLLKLNSSFKNHAEIARRINSLNLGWTAKVYDNMQDKTLGEMNTMYGKYEPRTNGIQGEFRFKSKASSLFFSSEEETTDAEKEEEENFYNNFYFSNYNENEMKKRKLRKTVDFRQFMGKTKSQVNFYAFSLEFFEIF